MNQVVLRGEVDEKKQSGSARDAEAKGRELYRAMQPDTNIDEDRRNLRREVATALQARDKEKLRELLKKFPEYSAVEREEVLRKVDGLPRTP